MFRILNALFLFLFFAPLCWSLQEDKLQKIYIVSDKWHYNYKTGLSIYEGNVKVDQGTTHITADKVTTKNNDKREIKEAIAYGLKQTAHYWTLPKLGDLEMHARANIIKFYPIESNVTLEKKVLVTQGENSFQGELILYNMNDETITVPASENARAVLIYNPDKL